MKYISLKYLYYSVLMTFYFGAHVSSTKLLKSLQFVLDSGGNFAQIFVNSPYGRHNSNLIKKYTEKTTEIRDFCSDNNMKLVIHSPYTLNFGQHIEEDSYKFQLMYDELLVAHMIGAIGCVIHVGKYLKITEEESIEYMYRNIKNILTFIKSNNLNSKLILETSAGQGTELFVTTDNSLEPLTSFYDRFTTNEKKYLKICIDTCHINSAGYCIDTKEHVRNLFENFERSNLLKNIVLIHYNDSKTSCCSRVDRHESLGHGTIGISALSEVLRKAYEYKIPCVLETPDDNHTNELLWMSKLVLKLKKSS